MVEVVVLRVLDRIVVSDIDDALLEVVLDVFVEVVLETGSPDVDEAVVGDVAEDIFSDVELALVLRLVVFDVAGETSEFGSNEVLGVLLGLEVVN